MSFSSFVTKPTSFIQRINLSSFSPRLNSQLQKGQLFLAPEGDFVLTTLEPGDRILINPQEALFLEGSFRKGSYLPAIVFSKKDGRKIFGFLPASDASSLRPDSDREEASVLDILKHPTSSMTIIYVLCPPDRKGVGSVFIKHEGQWLTQENGKLLVFRALAQSRRHEQGKEGTVRLQPLTDTPQGIYGVWASMVCAHPGFGGLPRLDLDGSGADFPLLPLNGHPYNVFKPLMDELVPAACQEDYWIHEWPLAYALGRYALRIHGNALDQELHSYEDGLSFTQTSGCLNFGQNMEPFLRVLEKIGVLDGNYNKRSREGPYGQVTWNVVSEKIGRTFVIVKDGEEIEKSFFEKKHLDK